MVTVITFNFVFSRQMNLTLRMTSAQVIEMSVSVTTNSPSQDYTHPDDHTLPAYHMTPGFKPFTKKNFGTKYCQIYTCLICS